MSEFKTLDEIEIEVLRSLVTPEQAAIARSAAVQRAILELSGKPWQTVEAKERAHETRRALEVCMGELHWQLSNCASRWEELKIWRELMILAPDTHRHGYLEWCKSAGIEP